MPQPPKRLREKGGLGGKCLQKDWISGFIDGKAAFILSNLLFSSLLYSLF
jgi:hypothetical protein